MEYQKEYTTISVKRPITNQEKNSSIDIIVRELIILKFGHRTETMRCEKRPNYETGMWEFVNNNQIVEKIEMTSEDYRIESLM